MKLTLTLLAALLLAPLATLHAADAAEPKPNIFLICTDDHGWADLGAQGVDKDIRAPHCDQIAMSTAWKQKPNGKPCDSDLLAALHSLILAGRQKRLRFSVCNPRVEHEETLPGGWDREGASEFCYDWAAGGFSVGKRSRLSQ